MIFKIYGKALAVLAKKPFKLWGISLLCGSVFIPLSYMLGGPVLLIGVCAAYLFIAAMANIYLKGYRGEEDFHAVDLFSTFKDFKTGKRVVCSLAWADLWKCLWLLIPFAGLVLYIIKEYEYRFVPYIIMEDESVAPTKAKEESSRMTKGYKSAMFWADVLFGVFAVLIFGVISVFASIPYIGILFSVILVLYVICLIAFGGLFLGLVHAAFYEETKNAPKTVYVEAAPAAPSGFASEEQ